MISFAGVTLTAPEPPALTPDIMSNKWRLLSGKIKIVVSPEVGTKITLKCHITTAAEFDSLLAKVGTPGTLTIDSATYTNMSITDLKKTEDSDTNWTYDITFERDTT